MPSYNVVLTITRDSYTLVEGQPTPTPEEQEVTWTELVADNPEEAADIAGRETVTTMQEHGYRLKSIDSVVEN